MKITKLLVALMAVAIAFSSCKKDDDDKEPSKRLVKVEITSSEYNETDTYTYDANNHIIKHTHHYVSETSDKTRVTTYSYNAAGEPTEWEQTGDFYGNGVTTLSISNNSIVMTKPSGDKTTYTLDATRRITKSDGTWSINYFYNGANLDRTEGLLSSKYAYDLSKTNVNPALGIDHWAQSENLVHKVWLYNNDDQSELSLLSEYTYQFNTDGTPATATMFNGFSPDVDFYVTYTYEEY